MVGDILRSARVKQGLTIADIEKGTSIRALYIESIEQGNIDNLPGMVYAKGFVRNYAGFLHLDAEELVQQFAEENGTATAPAAPTAEEKPRRISLNNIGDASLSEISIGGRKSSSAGMLGKLVAGIVVLVALVGGGAALVSFINSPARETAAPTAPARAESQPTQTPAAEAKDVRVSVHLTERCWTEVTVDGKTVFEGLLEEGKTENWQGKESIVLRAGNAGALEVTVNGKKLGTFGDEGAVVERTFTRTTKSLEDAAAPSGDADGEQPKKSTAKRTQSRGQ
ncbi:RodZ domain-containing protein [Selenomonas sp.]|uniref:helix-turn-helix domain-containing protein n=1 Tax=Selenomonas sp. TaxID=2053611 RepID=UPI001CAAE100|nr:RodZ domain-containing protein [Selenomonas sp.]MBF1692958.1 helix-turn-helix domain-containing protein [Selenomonas sp.]